MADRRLALVKSTLSNLPIYYMSLYKMLETIAKEIERVQRNFLWGGSTDRKKLRMVNWGI